jgi:hypothetical protein
MKNRDGEDFEAIVESPVRDPVSVCALACRVAIWTTVADFDLATEDMDDVFYDDFVKFLTRINGRLQGGDYRWVETLARYEMGSRVKMSPEEFRQNIQRIRDELAAEGTAS